MIRATILSLALITATSALAQTEPQLPIYDVDKACNHSEICILQEQENYDFLKFTWDSYMPAARQKVLEILGNDRKLAYLSLRLWIRQYEPIYEDAARLAQAKQGFKP